MDTFIQGVSTEPDWRKAIDECVGNKTLPPETNIGFVYIADVFTDELPGILNALKTKTGIEHWSGTVGMGICAPGREIYEQAAIVVLMASLPKDSFRIFSGVQSNLDEFQSQYRNWYQKNQAHLGILHGDPRNTHLTQLINNLAEEVPGGFMVGGLSSSRSTTPQIANTITSGGLSGVLISSDVPVVTGLTQGCTPIGPHREITRCEENIIIELDGKPALDVFNEDIGEVMAHDLERVSGYIFVGFPVTGSDTGDYLVRNLVGIDPDNKMIAVGEQPTVGQTMMVCRRDGNTAVEDMQRMLSDVKNRTGGKQPRGALYFSCLGRGRYLFGEHSEELKMLEAEFKDTPLAGFYCNGEIANNRLYGYTGVLTLFL
ncbi:MAG: FIST C-terminal domain-containing protein [Gammaproteobacteria bacterium]|nr:MAG: FIST C-terminal domain-containing protein [Gammaproteobacteria bacterium]